MNSELTNYNIEPKMVISVLTNLHSIKNHLEGVAELNSDAKTTLENILELIKTLEDYQDNEDALPLVVAVHLVAHLNQAIINITV